MFFLLALDPTLVSGVPVGEHDDIVAVVLMRFGLDRVDDQWPVMTERFLQRMCVPPIGARLADGEFVTIGLTGFDSRHADAGHSIHQERNKQAMPMDLSLTQTAR